MKLKAKKSKDVVLDVNSDIKKKKKKMRSEVLEKQSSTQKTEDPAKLDKLARRLEKRKNQMIAVAQDIGIPVTASNKEQQYLDQYLHIFDTLKELVTIAEDKYRESGQTREVYALMAMYSQMRECIADIRSVTDMSDQANTLILQALRPLAKSFSQLLATLFYTCKKLLMEAQTSKDINQQIASLEKAFADSGMNAQNDYTNAQDKIIEILVGSN